MYTTIIIHINTNRDKHCFRVIKVYATQIFTCPYVHLLPEYRPHLRVSMKHEDDHKVLTCCVLGKNLPQFDFGESPYHPLETNTPKILNGPTRINPMDIDQVKVDIYLYSS
jgi:hypothetical protein